MTAVRMYFTGDRVGPKFQRATQRFGASVREAVRGAAQDVADKTLDRGKQDIARAGNFGTRWTEGLHVNVSEGGGNIRIAVTHDLLTLGFRVHQFGATIRAKNPTGLLWIPLPGVRPDERGDFFAKSKAGNVLLFQKLTLGRQSSIRPLRVGKEQVTIPKRFHVLEIAREEARRIGDYFKARVKSARR